MIHYTLIGVDPGLVHNGVVALHFDTRARSLEVEHEVVDGLWTAEDDEFDPRATAVGVQKAVARMTRDNSLVFGELYRDRGSVFSTHGKMRSLERDLKGAMPYLKWMDNSGVKKIVTTELLDALKCGTFPSTHHRDLESAARIGIYGGLKLEEWNSVMYLHLTLGGV